MRIYSNLSKVDSKRFMKILLAKKDGLLVKRGFPLVRENIALAKNIESLVKVGFLL